MPCEDQEQEVLPLSIVNETSCSKLKSVNFGPERKDPKLLSELVERREVRPWSM